MAWGRCTRHSTPAWTAGSPSRSCFPECAADAGARERFLSEARAAARVKHDNVVTVYEADERDGVPYIAMEFLDGYPLDAFLKKKGNPTLAQTVRIGAEAAAGLAAAHRHGLVHRDVKPGNLWLEAPDGRVKVLDFGLAKPVDAEVELTNTGAVVGTPAYMSPVQARGERVDHRTDLFSLGAVLYRLCTGRLPFSGPTTMAVLMALGTEEPKPVRDLNPEVPEALAALVHQLLAKAADDRPQSALDVVKRLRAVAQELDVPMAQPVELSTSQPHPVPPLVVVPIPVTVRTNANPFADLDAEITEHEPDAPAPKPARGQPAGTSPWALAGLAALVAAVAVAGVVVVIQNKDGTETKIDVPDGATVTVKGKDGKTLAQVGPEKAKPAAARDPDRAAAEYALSIGGVVQLRGQDYHTKAVADLPKERFTLTWIGLDNNTRVTDAGLANFKDCTGLITLNLDNTAVTDAGLVHLNGCEALTQLYLNGTKVTGAGLAHLKGCKALSLVALQDSAVTDAGLVSLKDYPLLLNLQLQDSAVTDAGLAHLKDCKTLKHIHLAGTKVTDAGLAHLKACKKLELLRTHRTQVTVKGSEALHAALPGCRIEYDGGVIEPKK